MSLQAHIYRIEKTRKERLEESVHERVPTTVAGIRALTGYEPRAGQKVLEDQERRFNVEVLHRRFGKTVFKINKLIERAIFCPYLDGRYAYFAPTYSMAEDIAWHYLDNFTEHLPGRRLLQSKLAVFLPTLAGHEARIRLYGLDSPKQRVRGLYLDGAVFDEYPWIPPSAWTEQVRPMLLDINRSGDDALGRRNQWADFIFTPFGRNHAYSLYNNARTWMDGGVVTQFDEVEGTLVESRSDEWACALVKASESGILDADELAMAKVQMGISKYEQEMECSFDAAVEGAIYAREIEEARKQGRIGSVPWNKMLPVNTAWDLGYDDATAIWFYQQVGNKIHVIDYAEHSGAGLDFYADLLADRGYRYGHHLFPHDVEVTELGSGKSRRSILQGLGIRVSTVPKHKVWDGIDAGRLILSRAVFDHDRCAQGLDALALYRREYDEKKQIMRETPRHDRYSHGADAWRYLAMGLRAPRTAPFNASNLTHGEF